MLILTRRELEIVDAGQRGIERGGAEQNLERVYLSLLVERSQARSERRLGIPQHPARDLDAPVHLRALLCKLGLLCPQRRQLALNPGESRVEPVERERRVAGPHGEGSVLFAELLCARAEAA